MKKNSLIVILIFLTVNLTYSETLRVYKPARILGMGTDFITDASCYDGFFVNPALLGIMENKKFITALDLRIGCNKTMEIKDLLQSAMDDSTDLEDLSTWTSLLGLACDVDLAGPLMFGIVKDNFAVGFSHVTYGTADFAGISNFKAFAGMDFRFDFGYGRQVFNANGHSISVGGTIRFFLINRISVTADLSKFSTDIMNALEELLLINTGFGVGFDVGLLYRCHDFLSVGLSWVDAASPYGLKNMVSGDRKFGLLQNNLTLGLGFHIPVDWSKGVISKWNVMMDLCNIVQVFDKNYRNPWLNLAVGMEIELFKWLSLRTGMSELYWHTGIGFGIKMFKIDFAVFGRELSGEPGSRPQFDMALSFRFVQ